jgi:hypothetical protein
MEIEGKGLENPVGLLNDEKACSTPGCDHAAQDYTPSKDEQPGALCDCCRRRSLERRLSDIQVEARLLPGKINSLPRHCLHEVRPGYEAIST